MKKHWLCLCLVMPWATAGLFVLSGCDSGEKARDELTGNRAVKQYHQSTKKIEKIVDRQSEKEKSLAGEEKEEDQRETSQQ